MNLGRSWYEQITALRDFTDDAERGYRFETILREILPWSTRPPVVMIASSEQMDAFFEWNNSLFLVEAKAKKAKPITAGSHDWEDFELKLRKRKGACIGLFCSLYAVHENVIRTAEALNREGVCTIVLHGEVWDQLEQEQLPLDKLIQYLILHARAKFKAVPPEISEVRRWIFDREAIFSKIGNLCGSYSAMFLRRYKNPKHSDIYVTRHVDERISNFSNSLTPSKLSVLFKQVRRNDADKVFRRQRPHQICVIRDSAGSGKTTLAVQMALSGQDYFGASRSALENNVDDIGALLEQIGSDYGLQELITVDRPIIFAIDSLDEANAIPEKKHEILSLVRFLDELNETAAKSRLLAFPVGLVFTVREEYWRLWQYVFEGRPAINIRKRISKFTDHEFDDALARYSSAYGYVTASQISSQARKILSVPFNLKVFSEANEYLGFISAVDPLVDNVMDLYLTRKGENILRQRIPGFNQESFLRLCAELAMDIVAKGHNSLSRSEILKKISDKFSLLSPLADQVILAIVSEQILVQDPDRSTEYRFSHTRFLEYLVAYSVVSSVDYHGVTSHLDTLTSMVVESNTVLMYSVHEYVRYICKSKFPHLVGLIEDYYASSHKYMTELVRWLRDSIATGVTTSKQDIKLILKNTEASNPEVAWDSFFILAAKHNRQPKERLIEAFKLGWRSNPSRSDRWKLVQKLSSYNLLLNEAVFFSVLESDLWKDWQVYLGCIVESPERGNFLGFWEEVAGAKALDRLRLHEGEEWERVIKLLEIILENKPYIPGC